MAVFAVPNYLLFFHWILLLSLLLDFSLLVASHSSVVKFLLGFDGPLPFELETGYVGVDEWEDVQLFYYFAKSGSNPREDPLVLWLTGGPGCSSFTAFAYEVGPLNFKAVQDDGSLPKLVLNPNSWTKVSSFRTPRLILGEQPYRPLKARAKALYGQTLKQLIAPSFEPETLGGSKPLSPKSLPPDQPLRDLFSMHSCSIEEAKLPCVWS